MKHHQLIFLFPGQGSHYIRMGLEFYQSHGGSMQLMDRMNALVRRDLTALIFKGPAQSLTRTANSQPAICAVNAVCVNMLRELEYHPAAVAGHSLGELAALYTAGVIDFETLIQLADTRGKLMQECADAHPGGMTAVIGLRQEIISDIIRQASAHGVICVANINTHEQIVLSGEHPALSHAEKSAHEAGALRVQRLKVGGPWHSPLMKPAMTQFESALNRITFRNAEKNVYSNVTAAPETTGEKLRENLIRQLCSPVLWAETITRLIRDYPDAVFVEVGPGRVLKGMVLSTDRTRGVYNVEDRRSLNFFIKHMQGLQNT